MHFSPTRVTLGGDASAGSDAPGASGHQHGAVRQHGGVVLPAREVHGRSRCPLRIWDVQVDGLGQVRGQLCDGILPATHEEDLAALFCCPGNYRVINAIAAAGVPAYGGRTEGSMCAMAWVYCERLVVS